MISYYYGYVRLECLEIKHAYITTWKRKNAERQTD